MMRHLICCTLTTRDLGGTIGVEVRVGETLVGRYRPGTRYPDTAVEAVEEVIARLLASALTAPEAARLLPEVPDGEWPDP